MTDREAMTQARYALKWFAEKTDSAAVVAEQLGRAAQIPAAEMRYWCNRTRAAAATLDERLK